MWPPCKGVRLLPSLRNPAQCPGTSGRASLLLLAVVGWPTWERELAVGVGVPKKGYQRRQRRKLHSPPPPCLERVRYATAPGACTPLSTLIRRVSREGCQARSLVNVVAHHRALLLVAVAHATIGVLLRTVMATSLSAEVTSVLLAQRHLAHSRQSLYVVYTSGSRQSLCRSL